MLDIIMFGLCLLFILILPFLDAKRHYRKIIKNGSKNSLKKRFHTFHLFDRSVTLVTAILANTYFNLSVIDRVILTVVFFIFAGCWFGFWFNSQLSFLRGLYPWYVSYDDRAAWTDQTIIKLAVRLNIAPEKLNKRIYTWSLIISFIIFVLTYLFIFIN